MHVDHEDALRSEQGVLIAKMRCVGRHKSGKMSGEHWLAACEVVHKKSMLMRLPWTSSVIGIAIVHNALVASCCW